MKLEELCAAVQEARYYNERFTRREYTSAFRTYTERFGPLYMEAVRETAEDPDGRRVLAEQLLDLLEDNDDVQNVYANADFPEDMDMD